MNSKQRRQLKKKGPSRLAYHVCTNELMKWYENAVKDKDLISASVNGERYTHYELCLMWLKSQPDYVIDILMHPTQYNTFCYDNDFNQAVQDESERRLLGS